ncbi:threonylcarbamoyl-AMP synthase [Puteibacter caeruleilacunae]|nr:threonylcarbamoyl-AMP synthase [Puteibacter caeruleilacunae]
MSTLREEIQKATEVLQQGGIILYPTDTIWGIGCDATNAEAVKRIYEIKQREDSKSMLVLMNNPNMIERFVEEVPEVAWDLLDVADKPMTIIYPGAKNFAANLVAEDRSIGIRLTEEAFSSGLLSRFRKPIVSTSANISGEPSPKNFGEISEEIKGLVDYVVDFRRDEVSNPAPSSILKLGVGGEIQILRK